MRYDLKVISQSAVSGNLNYLKTFKFPNGRVFPKSYQLFVEQFGWGRTLNNYLIYIPVNDTLHDSWQQTREAIKSTYINDLDDYIDYYPENILNLMTYMEPFAKSESGFYLFWDIESQYSQNEFDIYATDFVGDVHCLGRDLFEVFYNLTHDTNILKKCFNREPFPKTFEGFSSIC